MCIIFAVFHSVGKSLRQNTALKISVIVWIVMGGNDFRTWFGIPTGPGGRLVFEVFGHVMCRYQNFFSRLEVGDAVLGEFVSLGSWRRRQKVRQDFAPVCQRSSVVNLYQGIAWLFEFVCVVGCLDFPEVVQLSHFRIWIRVRESDFGYDYGVYCTLPCYVEYSVLLCIVSDVVCLDVW